MFFALQKSIEDKIMCIITKKEHEKIPPEKEKYKSQIDYI